MCLLLKDKVLEDVREGRAEGLRALLMENPLAMRYTDLTFGRSLLAWAASRGHLNIVRLLIELNAPVNYICLDGDFALNLAAFGGHLDIVQALLAAGTDIDTTDKHMHTSLMIACAQGEQKSMLRNF